MPISSSPIFASLGRWPRLLLGCALGCMLGMVLILTLGACAAPTGATVAVTITGLDASAVSVQLDAQLGELPLTSKLPSLTETLDSFTVRLAGEDRGELQLQAQAIGTDGCVMQQGVTTVTIGEPGDYTATIAVAAQQGCVLRVVKSGSGAGRVTLSDGTSWDFPTPDDEGDACPVAEDSPTTQEQVYTLNTKVDLHAAALPNENAQTTSYFGGWQEGCAGSGDCSVTIGPGTTTVRLDFLPTEACSLSHFCWEQPRPQGANLRQISGRGSKDVWGVGEAGSMLRWNGSYWLSPHRPQLHTNLNAIWVGNKGNVWAVGESGVLMHRNSSGLWACPATLTTVNLNGIWGSDDDNIWAVGAQGTIARANEAVAPRTHISQCRRVRSGLRRATTRCAAATLRQRKVASGHAQS